MGSLVVVSIMVSVKGVSGIISGRVVVVGGGLEVVVEMGVLAGG